MEKYFNRPPELERLGILSFFSYYNFNPANISNNQRIDQLKKQFGDGSCKYIYTTICDHKTHYQLIQNGKKRICLQLNLINKGMLFPSNSMLKARAVNIK